MAICTAVRVSSRWIGPPKTPHSCSHFDNVPLGDSGIRHAKVRMRKLVKLGMTMSANNAARHFSRTLNARKYATGKPMTTQSTVATTAILMVAENVL